MAGLERESFLKNIAKQLTGHPELMELVEAVEMLDGDCLHSNRDLADLIGTSISDIENRKKRLRRLLVGLRHEIR